METAKVDGASQPAVIGILYEPASPLSRHQHSHQNGYLSADRSAYSPRDAYPSDYNQDQPEEEASFSGRTGDAVLSSAADVRRSWREFLKDPKTSTTVLVNLSAIMERTDEQLLPAVYAFVAASFNATPSQLGYLTQSRALVQALASPLGGFMGHYFNRIWVITCGCTIWGVMTALFSGCTSLSQGYILWGINGIGLSLVIPTGQSLTADYFDEASRGRAFGALYLTGAVGAMLGALYATNLGHYNPMGMEGWRFAFLSVAIMSLMIGILNFAFGKDPRCRHRWQLRQEEEHDLGFKNLLGEMKDMFLSPTFLIIILQGIVGSTPWNALVFLTLYMQMLGMPDLAASLLMALFLGGSAIGGLLGGWVGDKAAALFPNHGRIVACQFSVAIGVPLSFILFKGLPYTGAEPNTLALYAVVLGWMGLLISWAAPACNNPIFAEIVPPHLRTMIYAFDRSFESAIAACAAPLVGIMAERLFGFTGSAAPESQDVGKDLRNAKALGNALLVCTALPWGLCATFYIGLHFTYPKDKRKAQEATEVLRQVLPQDAQPLPQDSPRKSDASPSARQASSRSIEKQRLLSNGVRRSDSSLELTSSLAEEQAESLPMSSTRSQTPEPLDLEREQLLRSSITEHDSSVLDGSGTLGHQSSVYGHGGADLDDDASQR